MAGVGVVVGMASEARVLRRCAGVRVACSGADAARARRLVTGLLDGCDAIASFGLAGGLDPALPSGSLCLPEAVMTPAGVRIPVDADWRARLIDALGTPEASTPLLIGLNEPVATPARKRALFAGTGAAAIDMESHAVAQAAHGRGVPFLVIRAVADAADRGLPPWLGGVIGEHGRPRIGALLAGLARNPGDLAALIRLGGDARRGLSTLRRVAAGAGPFLAFRP